MVFASRHKLRLLCEWRSQMSHSRHHSTGHVSLLPYFPLQDTRPAADKHRHKHNTPLQTPKASAEFPAHSSPDCIGALPPKLIPTRLLRQIIHSLFVFVSLNAVFSGDKQIEQGGEHFSSHNTLRMRHKRVTLLCCALLVYVFIAGVTSAE